MPTYEYACRACGHEFEREQRISEDPIKKCPSCGKAEARRLISRTSFVLKGGGWYSDLYASKPAAKAGGEPGAKGDGEKGADAGSAGRSDEADKAEKPAKTEATPKTAKKTEPGGPPKGSKSAA